MTNGPEDYISYEYNTKQIIWWDDVQIRPHACNCFWAAEGDCGNLENPAASTTALVQNMITRSKWTREESVVVSINKSSSIDSFFAKDLLLHLPLPVIDDGTLSITNFLEDKQEKEVSTSAQMKEDTNHR